LFGFLLILDAEEFFPVAFFTGSGCSPCRCRGWVPVG
jgi:hypothetical protein